MAAPIVGENSSGARCARRSFHSVTNRRASALTCGSSARRAAACFSASRRRYEDASLRYTGITSHEGLTHYGLYDTVVARE